MKKTSTWLGEWGDMSKIERILDQPDYESSQEDQPAFEPDADASADPDVQDRVEQSKPERKGHKRQWVDRIWHNRDYWP